LLRDREPPAGRFLPPRQELLPASVAASHNAVLPRPPGPAPTRLAAVRHPTAARRLRGAAPHRRRRRQTV